MTIPKKTISNKNISKKNNFYNFVSPKLKSTINPSGIKPNTIKSSLLSMALAISSFTFSTAVLATVATTAILLAPTAAQAKVAVTDFSELVSQVTPGVVRVNVTKKISEKEIEKAQTAVLLKRFFGDKVNIPDSATKPAVEHSYGSAFFVSIDGYMLTNHHVIEGADTITVTLNDQQELDAKIIGSDKRSDIAVLKVEGSGFSALSMGDSSALRVGEPVLAIGSPFGFDYSASAGIVSAKSRNFSRSASVPFIQTDVALNPGNSGGPLFNQKGEVIGINSRIFSKSGGYMGLSFSIPIDEGLGIYKQLKEFGKVNRGYIGLFPQDMDRNLAEAFGLKTPHGALIARVSADSPAKKAGIVSGDVVLKYGNKLIRNSNDLINYLNLAQPNQPFKVLVLRNGKKLTLSGQYGKEPNDITGQSSDASNNTISLGLHIRVLSAKEISELQQYIRFDGGLLITAVDPTGLAGRSGLKAGDIISSLNKQPITSVQSFKAVHKSLPKNGVVTVGIIRRGIPTIIGLRIE